MSEPLVEPVLGHPAVVTWTGRRGFPKRSLVVTDYHASIETGLRYEREVELPPKAAICRERLLSSLGRTDAGRLVVPGNLGHRTGDPDGNKVEELHNFATAVADHTELTVVPDNHGGGLVDFFGDDAEVADPGDVRLGGVGFYHSRTWSSWGVLAAGVACPAHGHPAVRLENEVGGARKKHVWLYGTLTPEAFAGHHEAILAEVTQADAGPVVFPVFNDTSDGAWVDVSRQGFLSSFLPDGFTSGETYLLDGTRLGDYRNI